MQKVDLEVYRKKLDREVTFFHFKRALIMAKRGIILSKKYGDKFFFDYFTAQKHMINENFARAIYFFDKALCIRVDDGCTYNDKAICLTEMKLYKSASACFNQGLKKDRNCIALYHNKGWFLHLQAKYRQAIICFMKALELDMTRSESLYSLGDSYYKLKNYSQAKKYFKQALKSIKGKSAYMYKHTLIRLKELEPLI